MLRKLGVRCFPVKEGSYKYGKEQSRINPLLLNQNWKYQSKLMVFNIYRERYRNKYRCKYIYIPYIIYMYVQTYSYACLSLKTTDPLIHTTRTHTHNLSVDLQFIKLTVLYHQNHLGGLLKHKFLGLTTRVSVSVELGWSLIICTSNKFLGDADHAGLGTTL